MSQQLLLGPKESMSVGMMASKQHSASQMPHDRSQTGQAFSSELDRHLEKKTTIANDKMTSKKLPSTADDKEKVANKDTENVDHENGKIVPEQQAQQQNNADSNDSTTVKMDGDENRLITSSEQSDPSITLAISNELNASDDEIAVSDALLTLGGLQEDNKMLGQTEIESQDSKAMALGQVKFETQDGEALGQVKSQAQHDEALGQIQTQELHAVVQQTKDLASEQLTFRHDDKVAAGIGQQLSNTVKIMATPSDQRAQAGNADATLNIITDNLSTQKSDKEADKNVTKLRPDLLQALSQHTSSDGKARLTDSVFQKMTTAAEQIVATEKNTTPQIQLSELVKSAIQQSSQSSDKPISQLAQSLSTSTTPNVLSAPAMAKAEVPIFTIQPSLENTAWNRVLSSRVIWMAREGIQQATLKLNPANLGPVEVRLNITNDQANLNFIAHHSATRDALEQALPRLRESFAQNGLELADTEVSQQSFEQAEQQQGEAESMGAEHDSHYRTNDGGAEHVEQEEDNKQDVEVGLSVYA